MRAILKGLGALVVLILLLAGAAEVVAYSARRLGKQIFHGVDPTVAAASVGAMSTIIVAVATLVIGRYVERRKAIEAEIRASKIPVYSRLVGGLMSTILNGASQDNAEQIANLLRDVTPDLVTWASDDVLIAWARFKREVQRSAAEDAVFEFEKLLLAIRRDYGHSGSKVTEGQLLALFINDVDEQLARRRAQS